MAQIKGISIPDKDWSCAQWIEYHSELKKEFGLGNANVIFTKEWQMLGTTSWYESLIGNCQQDSDFIKYFKKQGIDIANVFDQSIATISDIGNNILGLGKLTTNIIMYGVPIVLIAVLIPVTMFLFRAGKTATVGDIVSLTSAGRATKLLK